MPAVAGISTDGPDRYEAVRRELMIRALSSDGECMKLVIRFISFMYFTSPCHEW
jgi:hypothetical protein